jgi:hypothetical protein
MKKNKILWRSQLPRFWKTAVKYRKLLVSLGVWMLIFLWIGIYFFPYQHSTDIILPPGSRLPSFLFIEDIGSFDPYFFQSINAYKKKQNYYKEEYEKRSNQLPDKIELFPISSNGQERVLVVGSEKGSKTKDYSLYLYNTNFDLLEKKHLYGLYFDFLVSANNSDRLWIQEGDGGNGGYLGLSEIKVVGDKIFKTFIKSEDQDYGGLPSYKIINPLTDPKIVVHRRDLPLLFLLFHPYVFFNPFMVFYIFLQMSVFSRVCYILLLIFGPLYIFSRSFRYLIKSCISLLLTTFCDIISIFLRKVKG